MGWFKRLLGMEIEYDFEARGNALRANSRKSALPEVQRIVVDEAVGPDYSIFLPTTSNMAAMQNQFYDRLLLDAMSPYIQRTTGATETKVGRPTRPRTR